MATTPARPVIRYYGGKFRIAAWIVSFFPAHRTYIEPFAGAASVLMAKQRSQAEVYNDLDGELVSLFRVLRDPGQAGELQRRLELTPYARGEWRSAYEFTSDPIEMARRSIVRAFMGFGSSAFLQKSDGRRKTGFRRQKHSQHSAPSKDWANYSAMVPIFCDRLRGVLIENEPANAVIEAHDSAATLMYVDPPYPRRVRGCRFEHPYRYEFSDDDHRSLARLLHSVAGMVVISGYPCALYDTELYEGWERYEHRAFADGGRERTEVLWLSPAASAARRRAHPELWDASDPAT